MKNGYCVKCRTDDPKRRIFPVNSEAEKCFCPHCLYEYKPKDAINHYNHFIRNLTKKADTSLHIAKMPDVSYDRYGYILEFEPDYVKALLGRSLSLLYLSTLRRSRFKDVMMMLDLDTNRYHLVGSHDDYFNFLRAANGALEIYREKIFKKLTFKGYFYDMPCLKLYVTRLEEIITFKDFIMEEFKLIGNQLEADLVKPQLTELDERLNKTSYITVDGYSHLFKGFGKERSILFADSTDSIDVSLSKFKPETLEPNDKKIKVIKDVVFKSNRTAYGIAVAGLVIGIIFAVLALGLLITSLFFIGQESCLWFLILGGLCALVAGGLILWQFLLKRRLHKRSF